MDFYNHILEMPFDVCHFDVYVFLFGWMGFLIVFLRSICKVDKPTADMKGSEHGSNDFQTDKEREQFLKNYTTPILPYIEPEVTKEADKER